MKITAVDVIALATDPGCTSRCVFAQIKTDDGVVGLGEAAVAIGAGAPAVFELIKDIAPMILGMDPNEHEVIWEKLFKGSFWAQGNGAVFMGAIAAIDIALWDIKAKAAGLPLYKLLGGKQRPKLRAYASQLQFGWGRESFTPWKVESGEPEFYREGALKAVADGYNAIKINFLRFDRSGAIVPAMNTIGRLSREMMRLAEQRLAATRDAVGPDVEIILENHAMTDASTAIQFAKMAEPYDIMFLEEGATPLNPDVFRRIADNTSIPLATGERTYTRWGFKPFFDNRSLTVIQPDIGNCGGITECKKICDMAYIYDVGVQTHVCSSPLSVAISLHFEVSLPHFVIHEHHIGNALPSVARQCKYNYQPKNGYFEIPELPGIGNELSEEALENAKIVTVQK